MLSERQAWERLAKAWDAATPGKYGSYSVPGATGDRDFGLCHSIETLEFLGLISPETAASMGGKIRCNGNYLWSLDLAGAVCRAAFCRNQARALTKRKAKRV